MYIIFSGTEWRLQREPGGGATVGGEREEAGAIDDQSSLNVVSELSGK